VKHEQTFDEPVFAERGEDVIRPGVRVVVYDRQHPFERFTVQLHKSPRKFVGTFARTLDRGRRGDLAKQRIDAIRDRRVVGRKRHRR